MPMPAYPLTCSRNGCGRPAIYKIAARWSDGATEELKTYALSCDDCLADWLRRSCAKQAAYHLATGESLDPPGIYRLERGQRDRQLQRLHELENKIQQDN